MLLNLKILFLCLTIIQIVTSIYLPVGIDKTAIQRNISSIRIKKRNALLLNVIAGIIGAAASTPIGVSLSEFYRASAPDECAISIRYKAKIRKSSLNMNFKTHFDDNWNNEIINSNNGFDKTKEKVSGGRLKLIQNYPEGKFCVEGIVYSCGSQVNNGNSERSIILDVETIRKAWSKKGNPRVV